MGVTKKRYRITYRRHEYARFGDNLYLDVWVDPLRVPPDSEYLGDLMARYLHMNPALIVRVTIVDEDTNP